MIKKEALIFPFYAKTTILLLGLFVFIAMLYIAQSILLPLVFSIIIAIVLQPILKFFVRLGINRIIAIMITLFLTIIVIVAFGLFLYTQISRFSDSWPILVEKFNSTANEIITFLSGYYDMNPVKIHEWITQTQAELFNANTATIGKTLSMVGGWLVAIFLVPVYIFLLLLYEPLIMEFIHSVFGETNQNKVGKVVSQTKTVIQRYLFGLMIEAIIVAALQAGTLFIMGVEYAILLGIIGALLNTIPYIGGLVAVALPMIVSMVTIDSAMYPVYILVIYYIIQLIDNNFIVPKIVASKVKINALFSILVVIAGNALWGIPGMFLSIPLLAIVKLIFDNIEPLKPWGLLLGDTMPSMLEISPIIKKIIKKVK